MKKYLYIQAVFFLLIVLPPDLFADEKAIRDTYVITIESVALKSRSGEWRTIITPDKQVDLRCEPASVAFFNQGRIPDGEYVNFRIKYLDAQKFLGLAELVGIRDFDGLAIRQGSFVSVEFEFYPNDPGRVRNVRLIKDDEQRTVFEDQIICRAN